MNWWEGRLERTPRGQIKNNVAKKKKKKEGPCRIEVARMDVVHSEAVVVVVV